MLPHEAELQGEPAGARNKNIQAAQDGRHQGGGGHVRLHIDQGVLERVNPLVIPKLKVHALAAALLREGGQPREVLQVPHPCPVDDHHQLHLVL